ncbi:N-terminal L-serine N(alpha)-acetyltransferase NAT4 [Aspergillus vadensis CBS 113365]|uniref:N-alpha-acetyltransferase 40 n=1 Tax=Aspergillus vadensis (strain CBS 113365 / IMI 142717 / IBT 24658) TaxID=1448311 RepID=A0A319BKN4_ASPVC|nr:GNAT family acetyltransferase Nat4 [Aspergillus vadensis CBS 113365]PYH73776.1 GNAT family acetyltransferase Nat4 [Aspergillus vadensis CBS 113365]
MSSSVQAGRVTKKNITTTARRRRVQHPKKTRASTTFQPHDHEYERNGIQYNPSPSLPLVERTNQLSIQEFTSKYITPDFLTYTYKPEPPSSSGEQRYKLSIHSAASIPTNDLNACFDLIEETSSEAYRNSSTGWSPSKKKKEMKLPDMKYLVVRREKDSLSSSTDGGEREGENAVVGFMSFMITYEDGKEVVYLYEIHLSAEVQKQGLGKRLLLVLMEIGRRVCVEKAMLTVFTSNGVAQRLYEAIGFGTDEYSPRPRRLRNGMVKEPDYRIMSVRLDGGQYV